MRKMYDPYRNPKSPLIREKVNFFENGGNLMITEPSSNDLDKNRLNKIPPPPALPMGPLLDPQGLILPRKPFNPCLDSKDRQDLHRELMFNQRIGKSVLNQKSELQRALEKHKDHQIKKELENEKSQNKTLLERVIEERARRLESLEKKEENTNRLPEFMQVHAKLRGNNKESK